MKNQTKEQQAADAAAYAKILKTWDLEVLKKSFEQISESIADRSREGVGTGSLCGLQAAYVTEICRRQAEG